MKAETAAAIASEEIYQEKRWPSHGHTVGEWILIMEKCLKDAKRAWYSFQGDDAALHEIRQVATCGVSCMDEHYAPLRGEPIKNGKHQDDLPQNGHSGDSGGVLPPPKSQGVSA